MISLWLLWGGGASVDKSSNRAAREDAAVVFQEEGRGGAPVGEEGEEVERNGRVCAGWCARNKRNGQAGADGPAWERMSDN